MVFVHKTAAVYGTVDALDASVGGKLPHDEPDVVRQFRNIFCVPGYHVFVVRVFSGQIFIVEITRRVDDGTDAIMFFYHVEKTGKPFAKALRAAFSYDFNVDDRNQVLFVQIHRACEVLELGFRIHCGTEEMIATDFQAGFTRLGQVVTIGHVDQRGTFCGFQVDVTYIFVGFHRLPVYVSLIA